MERSEAKGDRWIELIDGRLIGYVLKEVDFGTKVDPGDPSKHLRFGQEGYDESQWPTVSDLVGGGMAVEKYAYDEFTVRPRWGKYEVSSAQLRRVLAKFRRRGFNVTADAVVHCWSSWAAGLKSGYRDEEGGYHLFTPCGGNPLSFTATTLCPQASDWQITYYC